jgi:hypothetical protein
VPFDAGDADFAGENFDFLAHGWAEFGEVGGRREKRDET